MKPLTQEYLLGMLCVMLLILLEATGGARVLQRLVTPATVPVQVAVTQTVRAVLIPLSPLTEWYAPQKRIQLLAEQLAETEGTIARLELVETENAQLRVLLENRHLKVKRRRLARPIVSSVAPLVWLGEGSDVKSGWLVLYKDAVLGQVTSVEGQYARVDLLTSSPELKILVETESGVRGIAQGRNGTVIITNTPPASLITTGERVLTVGQPGVSPGKFIGLITAVEHEPNSAVQTVVLDQLVTFYQTSVVEIEE